MFSIEQQTIWVLLECHTAVWGMVLPSDVGSGKCEQYSNNCAAPSWLRQPRHLQDRNSLVPREWTSRTRDLVATPSVLSRVLLAHSFNCRAYSFSPEMPKRVGNYSMFVFCSVPLDMDNAAYPFLAYSGIPVVSFGFYDVSNVRLPGVLIPCRLL